MIASTAGRKIRVLIVDDSALIRRLFRDVINQQPDMEVVGVAPDPFVARDLLLQLKPDVMTLDIEMPRMDGLTFLGKVMHYQPMPVIVISSLTQAASRTAIEALRGGAVDVLAKPQGPNSVGELSQILAAKIRVASIARARRPDAAEFPSNSTEIGRFGLRPDALIAIGASTGGTQAIEELLTSLPAAAPHRHRPAYPRRVLCRLRSPPQFPLPHRRPGSPGQRRHSPWPSLDRPGRSPHDGHEVFFSMARSGPFRTTCLLPAALC